MREALESGDLRAALLVEADPVRDHPDGPAWEEALAHRFVVAVSAFPNGATAHADVVFPAEAYPEKEGTLTHPDGRLQRLRPAVPRPGDVRPIWQVLAELSAVLGEETGIDSAPEALEAIAAEVPFYAGLTPEEIGGTGVRWQERDAAARLPDSETAAAEATTAAGAPAPDAAGLQLGTYRDLWATEVTEKSPALRFLRPHQTLELAPSDAERLGVRGGDEVDVRSNGSSVRARVALRERIRPGSGFLIEGLGDAAAALGTAGAVEITRVEAES
jgi:NADH-quinone oxidoreductase subunit G